MAGKGWKMPLQAQPARGNVTGRNHLPNNAQETLGLEILVSLAGHTLLQALPKDWILCPLT